MITYSVERTGPCLCCYKEQSPLHSATLAAQNSAPGPRERLPRCTLYTSAGSRSSMAAASPPAPTNLRAARPCRWNWQVTSCSRATAAAAAYHRLRCCRRHTLLARDGWDSSSCSGGWPGMSLRRGGGRGKQGAGLGRQARWQVCWVLGHCNQLACGLPPNPCPDNRVHQHPAPPTQPTCPAPAARAPSPPPPAAARLWPGGPPLARCIEPPALPRRQAHAPTRRPAAARGAVARGSGVGARRGRLRCSTGAVTLRDGTRAEEPGS